MTARNDRLLCGWRVESDLSLSELPPWRGDDRASDLQIRTGSVPARLDNLLFTGPLLQIAGDGTCRYEIASIAAFCIRDGREIVVSPRSDAAEHDVRAFLFGPVLAILCYQRGLFPLHASCVEIDRHAVALAASAGMGKSTLAAAAVRAGHRVLSDDVTPIQLEGSVVRALPTVRQLALWPDVLQAAGISPGTMAPRRTSLSRRTLPLGGAFCDEPRPLSTIVYLVQVNDPRFCEARVLRGTDALAWLHDHLHTSVYTTQSQQAPQRLIRLLPVLGGIRHHRVLAWSPCRVDIDTLFAELRSQIGAEA